MTEPPKPQTVAQAAKEWLESKEGKQASFICRFHVTDEPLTDAFAAGVKWLTDELNEAMRKRGTLK